MPNENTTGKTVDPVKTQTIKGQLSGALRTRGSSVLSYDMEEMARNINLQSSTEFIQRYATGALTMIANQQPVTNKMMLDCLFNGFAPALSITAAKTGYNSIEEMKNAVRSGTVNIANFFQGLSNGLSIVTETMTKADYSKYGEEIPIDVITKLIGQNFSKTADKKVSSDSPEYVTDIRERKFVLTGVFNGNNAEIRCEKMVKIMQDRAIVTFREGRNIYETCVMEKFSYIKEKDGSIDIETTIKYYGGSNRNTRINKNTVKNQQLANYTSSEVYVGRFA